MISPRRPNVDMDHSPPRLVVDFADCLRARKGTNAARDLVANETTILLTSCRPPRVLHNRHYL